MTLSLASNPSRPDLAFEVECLFFTENLLPNLVVLRQEKKTEGPVRAGRPVVSGGSVVARGFSLPAPSLKHSGLTLSTAQLLKWGVDDMQGWVEKLLMVKGF